MNLSNSTEIQSLFILLLDSVLTKVSSDNKIKLDELKNSVGTITFTDNISESINIFCNSLKPIEFVKPKRIIKKATPIEPLDVPTEALETPKPKKVVKKADKPVEAVEAPTEALEVPTEALETPKPKKVVKKADKPVEAAEAPTEPLEVPKPKKLVKKIITADKPVEAVEAVEGPTEPLEAPKPKKLVKKITTNKVVEPVEAVEVLETPKPKTVVKNVTVEPIVDKIITDTVVEESEIKIKPKKIIVKRIPTETVTIQEQKKNSIKEVDIVEYGSDEIHDENAAVYDSIQMYEDDLLEPCEINGVKYLIDSSEYIYDMESQDLLGKLSEKDKNTILFLKNFTE